MQLAILDRIDDLRLGVPRLVDRYADGDPEFAQAVNQWLRQLEDVMASGRMAAVATVATLRGTLVAAEDGTVPEGMTFSGRATPRRIRDAVAADMLRRADDAVVTATSGDAGRFAEAGRLVQQMLPIALRKGLIGTSADSSWSALEADPDLAAVATHVVGLAGRSDALLLLGRALQSA